MSHFHSAAFHSRLTVRFDEHSLMLYAQRKISPDPSQFGPVDGCFE